MKKILKISFLLFAFLWMSDTMEAQKFGYLNSQAILAEMPQVKQLQENLKTLQTQLQKKGQNMLTTYQEKEQNAIRKKERGEMPPVEEEQVMKALQEEQEKIMSFERDMQKQIRDKEQELLQPIIDKINNAIKAVATENGYSYIFDSSAGVLLYADETQDVSTLVKSKLGM